MKARTDKHCEVNLFGKTMDPATFVKVFELIEELYPDCVSCSQCTSSIGNKISTSLVFRYTACKIIDKTVRKYRDPAIYDLCPSLHTDSVRLNAFIASRPVEDRPALLTLVYTAEEIVVNGRSSMVLTFEDSSRKITRIDMACEHSTFEAV
jgi:hypothetical protein